MGRRNKRGWTVMKVIELRKSVTESNDRDAQALREELKQRGIFLINLMSAPGSGKTTLLMRTITDLRGTMRIGVMEADIESAVDAERIEAIGAASIQIHTDGMCHVDAGMTKAALDAMEAMPGAAPNAMEVMPGAALDAMEAMPGAAPNAMEVMPGAAPDMVEVMPGAALDAMEAVPGADATPGADPLPGRTIFLENVGNLICPAEYDTGAEKNVMILSVPEGDDKPLKYPLMFEKSDVLVITKVDALPYFDFDIEKVCERAKRLNPTIKVFPVSAKTGEGMDAFEEWLCDAQREWARRAGSCG